MITFSNIGNYGHLGNQMFQYAALRGIAAHRGYEWAIAPESDFGTRYPTKSSIYSCFKLEEARERQSSFVYGYPSVSESSFHFDAELYDSCPDDVDLVGYFQTEKYFTDIKETIQKDFSFKDKTVNNAMSLLGGADLNNSVAMHVRRGDYVGNDLHHTNLSVEYYKSILSDLGDVDTIVICSDDIDWCRQNFNEKNIVFSTETPYTDMCIISMCRINIIANSSFGWWAAWLNKNIDKQIYCPKQWFGPAYSEHRLDDLIPQGWNII